MSKNFEALAIARENCEAAIRKFERRAAIAAVLTLILCGLVQLLMTVPAEVWQGVWQSMQTYGEVFLEHGLGLELALGGVISLLLFRDCILVQALRNYHQQSPEAGKAATNRWLAIRQIKVAILLFAWSLPLQVAVALVHGFGWYCLVTFVTMYGLAWWCREYDPIGAQVALAGGEADRLRRARDAGYTYGRFNDYDVPQPHIEAYPEGPEREAFLTGTREGHSMRIKLRRRGIEVDCNGDGE